MLANGKKMSTLKDIAQVTGFSIKTVSRVINGEDNVRQQVRDTVLAAAKELNYSPNRAAKSLRAKKSCEVTALCWQLDELFVQKFTAFEEVMRQNNFHANLITLQNQPQKKHQSILTEIIRQKPAGVLLLPGRFYNDCTAASMLNNANIPCVRLDSPDPAAKGVQIGRKEGVFDAVNYLCGICDNSVAYLGISSMQNDLTRLDGYHKAISANSYENIEFYESDSQGQLHAGYTAAKKLVKNGIKAVQTHSDVVAMGVLQGLYEMKIRVPDDIRVIGFDNRDFCAYSAPALTTIAQPNQEAGQTAAQMLLKMINPDCEIPYIENVTIPTKLIKRVSA